MHTGFADNVAKFMQHGLHDVISTSPLVKQCLDHLLQIRRDAQQHMTQEQQLWVKHRSMPTYKLRDQVWLDVMITLMMATSI